MIDLSPDHLETVRRILAEQAPGCEVRAFGSRVTWTAKEFSDLDLAVVGTGALDWGTPARLREAFEESDLPMQVDVLDWHGISESFREVIGEDYEVIQQRLDGQDMKRGWSEMLFSEAVQISPNVRLTRGTIYPFVDMASVRADARSVFSSEEREFRGGGSRFRTGDTLMARITPCLENGKIARYVAEGATLEAHGSTEFFVFRGRPNVTDNDFAYYLTQWDTVRDYAISQMTGTSGRQRVPKDSLDHLIVPIPPLSEQRAIAHILGALDDKIELNRRMNGTLEGMARALFKFWFVDFGPVRAKMEGRWRGGESLPGMPAELYDLFPDGMVDSELGEIPAGWGVVSLTEVMDFREGPGIRHWQYTNSPIGTRFINIRCIQNGDLQLGTANRIKTEEADGKYSHFHLKEWDIVVSTSGTLGRSAIVRKAHLPLILNTSVIRFRPIKNRSSFSFVCGYLNSSLFLDEMRILASGSVQKNFGPTHLKKMRVLCPTFELVERHEYFARALWEQVVRRRSDNDSLISLREFLLPKLISGELRI